MILVTGGTGQLGAAFRSLIPGGVFPGREALDLSRPGTLVDAVDALDPDAIINCAAYTAVDAAEDDEETARIVNAVAVGELARCAARRSTPLVTFSTDYVFDGTAGRPYVESDPTSPINAYGRSKLAGERLALEAHPGAFVVRTSWVMSATHPNFLLSILRRATGDDGEIGVVDDQHGSPTFVDDLARSVLQALERGGSGLLHLTNTGSTTWFGLARKAVEMAGLDPERIVPITTAEYPRPARRPAYSVLGSERLAGLGLDPLPAWQESLPGVVHGLMSAIG